MANIIQERLQKLPSVDAILQDNVIQQQLKNCPRKIAVEMIRQTITSLREEILSNKDESDKRDLRALVARTSVERMEDFSKSYYQRVVNAAGIVLHTGLGRAVLSRAAMQQIQQELTGYSLLQVSLTDGKRSIREVQVEKLLTLLTGAQAATVVNNNAAATADCTQHHCRRQRGHCLPRPACGNRRFLPAARCHGFQRCQTRRGRHNQQNPSARLRKCHHRKHRRDSAGPSKQLQNSGFHQRSPAQGDG